MSKQDFYSPNTEATQALQRRVLGILRAAHAGLTMSALGVELGMSRQRTMYHVKKMVVQKKLVCALELCDRNGGTQYRVWDIHRMVEHLVPGQMFAVRPVERVERRPVAHAHDHTIRIGRAARIPMREPPLPRPARAPSWPPPPLDAVLTLPVVLHTPRPMWAMV